MTLIFDYFQWWYGAGLKFFYSWWNDLITFIAYYLSFRELIRTLFWPWKRDVVFYGNSLDAKLKALSDNLISRFVGFILRLFVLIVGFVLEFILICCAIISLIIWLSLIPLSIFLIIKSFI